MRILICGGRDFDDLDFVGWHLARLHRIFTIDTLISGMASGADTLGLFWAKEKNIPIDEYPANWKLYDKKAGSIRNQQMIDEGKPDIVFATPGGVGTEDMVRRAKKHSIKVIQSKQIFFIKEDPVYGFLSNFYMTEQIEDDVIYKSNEHYYQSKKTNSKRMKSKIINASSPNESKRLANSVKLRKDWDAPDYYKIEVMMNGLALKFDRSPDLKDRLLLTHPDYLIEDTTKWNDDFWGCGTNKKGKNMLGRLLMDLRNQYLGETT